MEAVQSSFESSSSFNIGVFLLVSLVVIVCAALLAGGVLLYKRATDTTIRAIATAAIVAGVLIAVTILLAATEVISGSIAGPLLLAELALVSTAFWAIVLVDAATNESKQGNDKIVWVLIILLANLLGAFLYIAFRRKRRIAEQST